MGKHAFRRRDEVPAEIPVFPLAGCILLPRCELPLNIFEPRYVEMVDAALRSDRLIGMIQPLPGAEIDEAVPKLQTVGCLGRLTRFAETGDGRYIVSLEGISRFRTLSETTTSTRFRTFAVSSDQFSHDLLAASDADAVDRDGVLRALKAFEEKNGLAIDWASIRQTPSETLVNALSMMSPFGLAEKQALLEAVDLRARAELLIAIAEWDMASDGPSPTLPN